MGDLVWAKKFFFFSKPLVIESSSPTNNSVRFFFRIISHERYFFQCFSPGISLQEFFLLEISQQDIFSRNHPYPPFKSETVSPLVGEGYGCP